MEKKKAINPTDQSSLMTTHIFKRPITKAPLIVIISNNEAGLNRNEVTIMNNRSTIITIGKRRPVMTPSIHRELVRTYWNHRQLVKRYQAGQLTKEDQQIEFNTRTLATATLVLRDLLGIANNVTYINQH
jgi:hypothetical protein